jgi:hypothetical protein
MAEHATTRIDIEVRGGEDAARAASNLERLAGAEGKAAASSDALTIATDKQSKARERNETALDRLAKRYDADYKATQQVIRDQETLRRAYAGGLSGTEAYERALAGITKRHAELSRVANDNATTSPFDRATTGADRFANTLERVREFSWQNSTFSGDEIDRIINPLLLIGRTLGGIPATAIAAGAAVEGAMTLIGARAQRALADLQEVSRQSGLGINEISGVQIIGARGGLSQDKTRSAFENAGREFSSYARNEGAVKSALESIDKDFMKVADSARSAGEFIDLIGREIQSLPRPEALDLSKALLGDDAGTRLFESIRGGALSMRSLGDEAARVGYLNDEAARKAEEMQRQIDEAAQIANTKLLVAFQDLGSPIDNLKLGWYGVVGAIGDAITRSEELRQVMQGLLHPIDTIMGAPRVIGNLISGQAPQDRLIGRLIDMSRQSDFDSIKAQWMNAGPRIEFSTIGESRKRFEDRANADEKESTRGAARGGARSGGLSDASRAEEQYAKITRELQGQLSLLISHGVEHDRIKLALDIEKQQIALGSGATEMQKKSVADLVTKIDDATKAQKRLNDETKAFNEAYSSVATSLSGALKDIARGGNGRDALDRSLSTIEGYLFDATLTGSGPLAKALGFAGKDGAVGGAFGTIGSALGFGQDKNYAEANITAGAVNLSGGVPGLGGAGGSAGGVLGNIFDKIGSFFNSLGANADGTDAWRGGWSIVGERGPELLNLPRGSQIMSNEQSVSFARDQAVAARSHAAAMAMVAAQPSAPAGQPGNVYVSIEKAPANAHVEHSTDSKGNRRVRVVFDEAVASSLHSPHGRSAMAAMGVKPRLARM